MASHQQETSKGGHVEVGPEDTELAAANQCTRLRRRASPCLKGDLSSTLPWL